MNGVSYRRFESTTKSYRVHTVYVKDASSRRFEAACCLNLRGPSSDIFKISIMSWKRSVSHSRNLDSVISFGKTLRATRCSTLPLRTSPQHALRRPSPGDPTQCDRTFPLRVETSDEIEPRNWGLPHSFVSPHRQCEHSAKSWLPSVCHKSERQTALCANAISRLFQRYGVWRLRVHFIFAVYWLCHLSLYYNSGAHPVALDPYLIGPWNF